MGKSKEAEAGSSIIKEDDVPHERANWGSSVQFLLTMVGYAVGLGNVWRFPYLTYKNGGGAFVFPFVIMLILIGIPLSYLEMAFGQFVSLGPSSAFGNMSPLFKGMGYCMVIINTIISLYYNVIIAWSFYYFFNSITLQLPWTDCNNWWNNDNCYESSYLRSNCNLSSLVYTCESSDGNLTLVNATNIQTPSEQYYFNFVLRISSGMHDLGGIRWQLAACLFICWFLVFIVLLKGISSLGKVVYFTTSFPYVLLTVMLIRGATLEGASIGVMYYLTPDWSRLADIQVWKDAASQIFFALSACTGGLIAMSSFNPFSHNVKRDAIFLPVVNVITSVYAGFVIFTVLGFMANEKGVTVDDVADQGPGLVFIVYPEALTQMPFSPLWSMLFFFMLITLGFSSEFAMVECTMSTIIDEFPALRATPRRNTIFRACLCLAFYLISLPMVTEGGFYIFSLLDEFVSGLPLLFVAMLECVVIMYVYGFENFSDDLYIMVGSRANLYYKITWCFITPLILLVIMVIVVVQYAPYTLFDGAYVYSANSLTLGWVIVVIPMSLIPGVFILKLCRGGTWKLMNRMTRPLPVWGPASAGDRSGRYERKAQPENSSVSSDSNNNSAFDSSESLSAPPLFTDIVPGALAPANEVVLTPSAYAVQLKQTDPANSQKRHKIEANQYFYTNPVFVTDQDESATM